MVTAHEVMVQGRPVTVWLGGKGEPLLLLHGAWGGAAIHWAPVWDRLAERFRVIAPDLPGLTEGSERGPRTFPEYARWLEQLLDTVGISDAWCVGNSFGAALAWRFASLASARCRGLVLVNGTPPPMMPTLVRRLFALPPLRQLLTAVLRWNAFSPSTLDRAFADPHRAPADLRRTVLQASPPQLALVRDVVLSDDPTSSPPRVRALLVWGEADRLMGGGIGGAEKLHRTLPGSQLAVIPAAGHLPQVERPDAFVDALLSFIGSQPSAR
jgi:2-hydroxy-6-oxonona-2,4-dienedioate hydrolase